LDPDLGCDLGGDMGPTFRTPILELMPNVISKIKQNSKVNVLRDSHKSDSAVILNDL
jgi:hypothetical protein